MKSFKFPWIVLFIIIAVVGLDAVYSAIERRPLPFQTQFPDDFPTLDALQFVDTRQKRIKGEEFLGQAVLIVFFDPGCSKCTVKLPTIDKIRQTFAEEGLTVIGMSSSGGGISSIASQYSLPWIWATNSPGIKHKLHGNKTFEMFLFDRSGKIVYKFTTEHRNWKLHLELGIGAVVERALDLSDLPNDFVGSQVCGVCHQEEYKQWEQTAHAAGYDTLVQSRNTNRPECHSCHVTGEMGRKSRPWSQTPKELQEIGCEECHGPGGPHRTKPFAEASLYSTREESCKRCHNPETAGCVGSWPEPKWDYSAALKKVAHGTAHGATPSPAAPPSSATQSVPSATGN